jgi:glucosylceramidase
MFLSLRTLSVYLFGLALNLFLVLGCTPRTQSVPPGPDPVPPVNPGGASKTDIVSWMTSPDQMILFKKQSAALNFSSSSNYFPTILVDTTETFQTIDGFGFALTGGSAMLINQLASQAKLDLLNELFRSDSTFIGISYLRISIGASDLDDKVFSYDDIPANQTDVDLKNFSIEYDAPNLVPILKSILAINPGIKIMGSPWSAPAWMKTGQSPKGGSLKPEYYAVYANYLVKYVKAMEARGIRIDAITPQNEPLNPYNNPSMTMSAAEQAEFIKNHLGPAFQAAGIATKIIVYDHNCDVTSYPLTVLADASARKYVDGSAFHLYAGDIGALSQVHNAYPDKHVYFTEQWVGGPGNFAGDLKWHVKNLIIGATRNWSRNVIEWNLASDPNYYPHTVGGCSTCMGALTIGTSVTRNVSYYIIAHASKFVPAGSVRIGSNLAGTLANVAFKTPAGKKVLVVLNEGTTTQKFNIQFKEMIATAELAGGAVGSYVW